VTYEKDFTGLIVIDPYNDFISEGGKVWDRLKGVTEANRCVPHMRQVLDAAREAGIRVFYALHRRYRPGDYETWKYVAPIQKAAWSRKTFEYGTWGGEFRTEFTPQPGEIVAQEHWCSTRLRTHLSVGKDALEPRAIQPPELGSVVTVPHVGTPPLRTTGCLNNP